MKQLTLMLAALGLLVACSKPEAPDVAEAPAEPAGPGPSIYEAAVSSPDRLEGDYARDTGRKPAEVLQFLGIDAGDSVLDMFSGGGYYTDILSRVAGPGGRVVAHSNQAYLGFVGDEFKQRHAEGRLPNVEVLMAENNELALEAASFDAILLVLSFHDLYYANPDRGWPQIDDDALLAELYKGLKPGGIVGIVDHVATAGAPRETGGTLHRIDPAIVEEEMTAAGFVLEASSDVLRNPEDDHEKIVFDPDLRGKTDRFVMRWVRPAD